MKSFTGRTAGKCARHMYQPDMTWLLTPSQVKGRRSERRMLRALPLTHAATEQDKTILTRQLEDKASVPVTACTTSRDTKATGYWRSSSISWLTSLRPGQHTARPEPAVHFSRSLQQAASEGQVRGEIARDFRTITCLSAGLPPHGATPEIYNIIIII
jgi:hypothetical protein